MTAAVLPVHAYHSPLSERRPGPSPLNLSYSINLRQSSFGGPLISPARSNPIGLPAFGTPRTPRTPSFGNGVPLSRRRGSNSQDYRPTTPTSATARRFSLPSGAEQDHFESLCRARFYDGSSEATRSIETTLKDASPTAQSCYNRILSNVRAQYHEDAARKRREDYERIFQEARVDVYLTSKERKEKLQAFLESHASKEMIGTHPFAKALYAMLNLQAMKASKGGAGQKCLEWSLEDEVFMEAGPLQWTRESVALLKTILGFLDVTDSITSLTERTSEDGLSIIAGSHPSSLQHIPGEADDDPHSPFGDQHKTVSSPSGHARRASDPFSEANHSASTPTRPKRPPPVPVRLSTFGSSSNISLTAQAGVLQEGRKRRFRMSKTLGNPELRDLMSVFPAWIATFQARGIRFTTGHIAIPQDPATPRLLEEGALNTSDEDNDADTVKVGTGSLNLTHEDRLPGWEGSLVERMKVWLKRVFSMPC